MERRVSPIEFGLLAVLGGLVCACGSDPATGRTLQNQVGQMCAPGASAQCGCADGSFGLQTCDPVTSVYGACPCPVVGGAGTLGTAGTLGVAGQLETAGQEGLAGQFGTSGVVATAGVGAGAGAGAAGDGSAGNGAAGTGMLDPGGNMPTMLPTAKGACPPLTNGSNSITVNGKAMQWTIWVGSKAGSGSGGPIILYWHGTGTNSQEAVSALSQAAITEVTSLGGVVASAETGSATGSTTGNNVWYTGDADYADEIIACAMKQLTIDTRHIHTAGYSAGALQSAWMHASRSGYIASVVAYSGGASGLGGGTFQDPSNIAPVIGAHGSASGDFLAGSATMWQTAIKGKGAFVIDCDDGGSHVDISRLSKLGPSAWKFFKDHPFKIGKPDPYEAGIPAGFPAYCKIY